MEPARTPSHSQKCSNDNLTNLNLEKTSAPADLRAIIVSIDLLRSQQEHLEQFNSNEFIELARSSGLKVEHHIFSKQNFVAASHFLTKGKADELKTYRRIRKY